MSRHRIFARGGQPNGKGWRYGNTALVESARRADELAAAGDTAGVAVSCRIINAVDQFANTTPPGQLTWYEEALKDYVSARGPCPRGRLPYGTKM